MCVEGKMGFEIELCGERPTRYKAKRGQMEDWSVGAREQKTEKPSDDSGTRAPARGESSGKPVESADM